MEHAEISSSLSFCHDVHRRERRVSVIKTRRLVGRRGEGSSLDREVLTNRANENAISIAFSVERNSAMSRADLTDLTAFIAIADQRSFRAAASRLDVTPSALS